jgi:hypothetical protein
MCLGSSPWGSREEGKKFPYDPHDFLYGSNVNLLQVGRRLWGLEKCQENSPLSFPPAKVIAGKARCTLLLDLRDSDLF